MTPRQNAEPGGIPREAYPTLIREMMRRQAALSIRVAAVFLLILFVLPLVNRLLPEIANARIGGFTATWLCLAVLFYPVTWLLSWYFIKASDRIEAECSDWRKLAGGAYASTADAASETDARPAGTLASSDQSDISSSATEFDK